MLDDANRFTQAEASLRTRLAGVAAIPATPFGADGSIDEAALRALLRRMLEGGIDLVAANGNTSEVAALSAAEREYCARVALEECGAHGATVVVGVGGPLREAVREAEQALAAGAAGAMVLPPAVPYQRSRGIITYFAALAERAPLVPYVRGAGLDADVVRAIVQLPGVVGVKYALPDVRAFERVAESCRTAGVVPVCGLAEAWAPFFWLAGAEGFTSGLANVDSRLPLQLLGALRAGDWEAAMRIRAHCLPFEELRARHGNGNNVAAVKAVLARQGIGTAAVRPPLTALDPDDERALDEVMAALARGERDVAPPRAATTY